MGPFGLRDDLMFNNIKWEESKSAPANLAKYSTVRSRTYRNNSKVPPYEKNLRKHWITRGFRVPFNNYLLLKFSLSYYVYLFLSEKFMPFVQNFCEFRWDDFVTSKKVQVSQATMPCCLKSI